MIQITGLLDLGAFYLKKYVRPEMLHSGSMIPGFISASVYLCVFSAAEGRQFPSKPLRESQSRLLTSTPSWTESDGATDRDRKGRIYLFI